MSAYATASAAPGAGLRRLGELVAGRRRLLGLIAGLVLASAALELVPPLVVRQLVDEHLTPGRPDGLLALALVYLAATTAVQATGAAAAYLTAALAQRALHELRMRLYAHLQRLPVAYYDRTPLGDAISRCTADVETLETLFSSGVAKALADLARLATLAVAMVALSPLLALLSALVVPPLLGITRLLQVRIRAAERANREAVGLLNVHLQEALGGVEVIRAFERQAAFAGRFRQVLRQTLAAFNRATAFSAVYSPATALLAALATALLLWYGTGVALGGGQLTLGTLTAFVLLFQRFFQPITALGDEWQTVQGALAGAERIFAALAEPADRVGPPAGGDAPVGAVGVTRPGPAAELLAVDFGYLVGRPVLQAVSLAVAPGEHVALVGRTGAGKSSLLHLLGGLYAPWGGRVRVGGRDPRELAADDRRRLIGAVPQVVQLFNGSVLDNLTLYDRAVERAAVERAAALCGADGFIRALPAGYETLLRGGGGAGVQLSAGQRQLLALARALIWDPDLLLLDEATAAIDAASDASFRAALRADGAGRGRSVVTVAHRLSTALESDRVLVVEAGRIVEQGTPAELLARGGRFAALVELEAAGWDWRAGG